MNFIKQLTFASLILTGCNNVDFPKEKLYQFYTDAHVYYKNDTIYFALNNPVRCPLRYYIGSSDTTLDKALTSFKPITLQQNRDTILKVAADSIAMQTLTYPNILGDINQKITKNKISLPFPKGRTYKIVQGYNGSYSHNIDNYSRYSIDFNLKNNDTICAADDGFVVGVIKDYMHGGGNERWRSYANLITLYHPHSGLFTQYVHLTYHGNLVTLGDSVKMGQPIGLSGETGFTDVEHLHFMTLAPVTTSDGLNSVKMTFVEGYEGENLSKNDRVKK